MNKTSFWMLILLLPVLAALAGLTALPAACLAAEELTVTMSLDKEGVVQAGEQLAEGDAQDHRRTDPHRQEAIQRRQLSRHGAFGRLRLD